MRRVAVLLAAALFASSLVSFATPANADSATFKDGNSRGSMDIRRVRVINEKRLTVRVVVKDLRRRAGAGSVSVWLDKNARRSGPEFHIGSGLWESDWQIGRTTGWRFTRGPLNCPIDQRLLFKRDVIVFQTGRGCLGRYGKVRVSVTTYGGARGRLVDHSPRFHTFHRWVRRS